MSRTLKILLLFISIAFMASSQVVIHSTSKLYVDAYDGKGYSEYDSPAVIITDFDNDVVYIDTLEYYKVNYVEKSQVFNKYKLVSCKCIDSQGKNVDLEYFLYKDVYYLKISYSDMCIKYKVYYKDTIYDSKRKIHRIR